MLCYQLIKLRKCLQFSTSENESIPFSSAIAYSNTQKLIAQSYACTALKCWHTNSKKCALSIAQNSNAKEARRLFNRPRPLSERRLPNITSFSTYSLNSFLPITVSSSSSFLFADFSWKSLKCFIICFNLGSVLRNPVASKALAAKAKLKLVFGDDDDVLSREFLLSKDITTPIILNDGLFFVKWVKKQYLL